MPSFEYVSRDSRGMIVRGQVDAEDLARARRHLQQQGLFITALRRRSMLHRPPTMTASQVAAFTRHLEMLVTAGMPLYQSLETLAEQFDEKPMHEVVEAIGVEIREGRTLSAALGSRSDLFPSVHVGIIRQGETSGRLDQALQRLADYIERDLEFRRKIRDALIYPGLVAGLAGIVLAVFLAYIIPAFERVYRGAGADLPALTRAVLGASKIFRANFPLLAVAGAAVLVPSVRARVASRATALLHRHVRRLPRVGALAQNVLVSRFAQTMGALLGSGVPLTSALDVAGEATGSVLFAPVTQTLKTGVTEGRKLSEVMRQTGEFPPVVVRIVAMGEETGRLDQALARVGTMLEAEFDRQMRRLLTLLEPAITLAVGGLVGVILMALYLPIFGLSKAIVR